LYSTCLFCHADLGRNEVVEHFPVGRRLAYDATKGRLWVVCRRCERWNLTPVEERWEAIEECERMYTGTRLRASTDNIGLARVREGLELVRIGQPQRPEMAAWRYGDQFGKRRRKHIAWTIAGGATVVGAIALGRATGFLMGGGWGMYQLLSFAYGSIQKRVVRTRILVPDQPTPLALRAEHLTRAKLHGDGERWQLTFPFHVPGSDRLIRDRVDTTITLDGPDALRAAGKLLPAINAKGANKDGVSSAVRVIEETPDPDRLFAQISARSAGLRRGAIGGQIIEDLPLHVRLALEMAAHEEDERRALEGELALLEAAWREAEEIAGIADSMFMPADVDERVAAIKSGMQP
jgi:hypothetical protein